MPTEFKIPELGENVTAGDVVRLLVKPGDTIAMDQPVLELETDKATIEVPSDVQVLSLENRNDIVPHLDASDNPDSPNRTTVTFDNQTGGFSGNHAIRENYTEAARQLDSGSDPSVARFKESAGAFFHGDDQKSVTQNYHVARKGVNELP